MSMTHDEVIEHLCRTVQIIGDTKKDYSHASDGFCKTCLSRGIRFEHAGFTLAYVREAVIEKLRKDGYEPVMRALKEEGRV